MPQDHLDFALSNGSDALAITDHGNLNSFSHQFLHTKKLKDKGHSFKSLYGQEAYYIPSIQAWRKLKDGKLSGFQSSVIQLEMNWLLPKRSFMS